MIRAILVMENLDHQRLVVEKFGENIIIVTSTINWTLSNVARLGNLAYQGVEVCNYF